MRRGERDGTDPAPAPTAMGPANSVVAPGLGLWSGISDLLTRAREDTRRFTTMPVGPGIPLDVAVAPVSGAVSGTDPVFSAIVNGLNAPPTVQLPAMYPGGSTTVTPGSSGSRGPLLLAVLLAAGLGVWYFKNKGGK